MSPDSPQLRLDFTAIVANSRPITLLSTEVLWHSSIYSKSKESAPWEDNLPSLFGRSERVFDYRLMRRSDSVDEQFATYQMKPRRNLLLMMLPRTTKIGSNALLGADAGRNPLARADDASDVRMDCEAALLHLTHTARHLTGVPYDGWIAPTGEIVIERPIETMRMISVLRLGLIPTPDTQRDSGRNRHRLSDFSLTGT